MKSDISNQRFGRLVAIKISKITNKRAVWLFVCDCGKEHEAFAYNVKKSVGTKSCGCLRSERASQTGEAHPSFKQGWGSCKEIRNTRALSWHRNNPERSRDNVKRWREENPDKVKAQVTTNNARRRGIRTAPIAAELLAAKLEKQNRCCAYCKTPLDETRELDHVVPLSRGGLHTDENTVWACQSCNRSKGAKLVEEWKGPQWAR